MNDLTKREWLEQMERGIARTMPDMYPSGYARFLAESRANEGGYEAYIAGKFANDKLWEPSK